MDGEKLHGGEDKRKEMFEARITIHARDAASKEDIRISLCRP